MTPLWLRFAARELRSGVKGFRIFLACLALGVAAIAAASSTAEAFRRGLASEARDILGGDIAVSVNQRQLTASERQTLTERGRVTFSVSSPAMAQVPSGDRRLVEFRGVDNAYPLAGEVILKGGVPLAPALAFRDGVWGAARPGLKGWCWPAHPARARRPRAPRSNRHACCAPGACPRGR